MKKRKIDWLFNVLTSLVFIIPGSIIFVTELHICGGCRLWVVLDRLTNWGTIGFFLILIGLMLFFNSLRKSV